MREDTIPVSVSLSRRLPPLTMRATEVTIPGPRSGAATAAKRWRRFVLANAAIVAVGASSCPRAAAAGGSPCAVYGGALFDPRKIFRVFARREKIVVSSSNGDVTTTERKTTTSTTSTTATGDDELENSQGKPGWLQRLKFWKKFGEPENNTFEKMLKKSEQEFVKKKLDPSQCNEMLKEHCLVWDKHKNKIQPLNDNNDTKRNFVVRNLLKLKPRLSVDKAFQRHVMNALGQLAAYKDYEWLSAIWGGNLPKGASISTMIESSGGSQ